MPVLRHAIKKLRVDGRRTQVNRKVRTITKRAVKLVRTDPNQENLKRAFSALDQAVKKRVIHEAKANRLKSRLSLLVAGSEGKKQKRIDKSSGSGSGRKEVVDKKTK